jgi:FkbM family methyltransferase
MFLPPPPPWLFSFARELVRRKIKGGYQLIELLERTPLLKRAASFPLSERVTIEAPLWRRPNQLNLTEMREYERPLIQALAQEIAAARLSTVLVDCGADIGLVSGLLVEHCPSIAEVFCCEPNAEAFDFLNRNVARWPVAARALRLGVADFVGRGSLRQPSYHTSPHSAFIEADANGEFEVVSVDHLQLNTAGRCLVLKIDVEGGEHAVVRGALETQRAAARWIVTIEVHRLVVDRTGIDPLETIRLLETAGLGRVFLAERPEWCIDLGQPFLVQAPDVAIGNLVAVSG